MKQDDSFGTDTKQGRRVFLLKAGASVGALTLVLMGCGGGSEEPVLVKVGDGDINPGKCEPVVWDLIAGRTQRVGSVIVGNTDTEITVKFLLDEKGASLGALHLWLGRDVNAYPQTGQGIPVPGRFPFAHQADGETSYSFSIPISGLGFDQCENTATVHIAAHAEVRLNGLDETAWGGPLAGPGPRWWFRGDYELCCSQQPVN